jgi:membrane-associated phospholipid phosphatase
MISTLKISAEQRWHWLLPALALAGIALLLASDQNTAVFIFLNGHTQVLGDTFWRHVTVLGDTTIALMLMLPLVVRRPLWAAQFLFAALFATIYSHGMKALFASLRPPAVLLPQQFHLIDVGLQNNSFPSGHTTTIFLLAAWLCMQVLTGRARYVAVAIALLVGLSRIACGVHWPLDVLGGMAGGWLSAWAGIKLADKWSRFSANVYLPRVLAVSGLVLAVWSWAYYDNAYTGTWWLQATLSVVSAGLLLLQLPRLWLFQQIRKYT